MKFEGGDKNQAYIQHLREEFDDWCLSGITSKKRKHPNTGTEITNWSFQTISHPDFKYFADLFLNEARKKKYSEGFNYKNRLYRAVISLLDYGRWWENGSPLVPNQGKGTEGTEGHTQAFSKEEVDSLDLKI